MNTESDTTYLVEQGRSQSGDTAPQPNPIDSFLRTWRFVEKIALSVSVILVVGTIGYISLHSWI